MDRGLEDLVKICLTFRFSILLKKEAKKKLLIRVT